MSISSRKIYLFILACCVGLLAYALNEAGRLALAEGDTKGAAEHATEALQASQDVGRVHQHDRALLLRARAAFVDGDLETTAQCIHQLESRLENLTPEYSIHQDLCRLREDLTNRKDRSK